MSIENIPSDQLPIVVPYPAEQQSIDCDAATMLVVEDNIDVRMVAEDLLKLLGYRVICTEDGSGALDVLETDTPIDLQFTDMVLPGELNGRTLMEAALKVRPDIKMLGTSGYAEEAMASEGTLPAGTSLLPKPYTVKALTTAIEQALSVEESLVA